LTHASSNQLDASKHVKYSEELVQDVISRPTGLTKTYIYRNPEDRHKEQDRL